MTAATPSPVPSRTRAVLSVSSVGALVPLALGTTLLGVRWGVLAGVASAATLAYGRSMLDLNRRTADHPPLDSLGFANGVTLFRGILVALTAGFLVVPPTATVAWVPPLLYGAVVLLDVADGALARATHRTTLLGARLDTAIDAAGLLVAGAVGVAWGALPPWFLAVGAARYCYVAGLLWRRRRGLAAGDLPPSTVRRPLAALAMVVTAGALVPVTGPPLTSFAALAVGVPFLVGFVRDWWAVSGP